MAGLYVATLQIGGGVGSIVPENLAEYVLFIFCLISGSVMWAIVVGTICGLMATADPHDIAFRQNMDQLNYFMRDMQITQSVRIRAREYLRNTKVLACHIRVVAI